MSQETVDVARLWLISASSALVSLVVASGCGSASTTTVTQTVTQQAATGARSAPVTTSVSTSATSAGAAPAAVHWQHCGSLSRGGAHNYYVSDIRAYGTSCHAALRVARDWANRNENGAPRIHDQVDGFACDDLPFDSTGRKPSIACQSGGRRVWAFAAP
jgi:hypothetical protein